MTDQKQDRRAYAMIAPHAMLSNKGFQWDLTSDRTPEENVARRAFAVADAMMAQEASPHKPG